MRLHDLGEERVDSHHRLQLLEVVLQTHLVVDDQHVDSLLVAE